MRHLSHYNTEVSQKRAEARRHLVGRLGGGLRYDPAAGWSPPQSLSFGWSLHQTNWALMWSR